MLKDLEWKRSVTKLDVSRKISARCTALLRNKHSTQLRNSQTVKTTTHNVRDAKSRCSLLSALLSVTW